MIVKEVGTHQPGIDSWNDGCEKMAREGLYPETDWLKLKMKSASSMFTPYDDWMTYFEDKNYILVPDDETIDKTGVFVTRGNDHNHISEYTHYDFPRNAWDYSCGVCDNATQLLAHYNRLLKKKTLDKNQTYLLCMKPMFREYQPEDGGWRWHKWGEYIGVQNPQYEYLADEKGIDLVYCFHIYKVTKKEIYK